MSQQTLGSIVESRLPPELQAEVLAAEEAVLQNAGLMGSMLEMVFHGWIKTPDHETLMSIPEMRAGLFEFVDAMLPTLKLDEHVQSDIVRNILASWTGYTIWISGALLKPFGTPASLDDVRAMRQFIPALLIARELSPTLTLTVSPSQPRTIDISIGGEEALSPQTFPEPFELSPAQMATRPQEAGMLLMGQIIAKTAICRAAGLTRVLDLRLRELPLVAEAADYDRWVDFYRSIRFVKYPA